MGPKSLKHILSVIDQHRARLTHALDHLQEGHVLVLSDDGSFIADMDQAAEVRDGVLCGWYQREAMETWSRIKAQTKRPSRFVLVIASRREVAFLV